ncbi:MAG: transketolase [Spirochaetes bacterium]|nr:transketolase [Spirochaetota bacterium]
MDAFPALRGADRFRYLREKAHWLRRETLRLHKVAPETRVASSLSDVEIFTALWYGGLVAVDPRDRFGKDRTRFLLSKGHGGLSMYPILAEKGFFPASELENICKPGTFLGGIPDPIIPGFETVNGSLGHGPGVATGMALGLKRRGNPAQVVVVTGDGELYEGSVWEAILYAPSQRLDNLTFIVDRNDTAMLNFTEKIAELEPLADKFRAFRWETREVDGHDVEAVWNALTELRASPSPFPRCLIARTVKGKGAPTLEGNPLSHITSLKGEEVDRLRAAMGERP